MNESRLPPPPTKSTAPTTSGGLWAAWVRFWFTPADPVGLAVFRVLGGVLLLFWLVPFVGNYEALFGLGGWFDARAYGEASRLPELPPHLFGWSIFYWCGTDPVRLALVYWLSLLLILLFTVGLWTRVTGVLTWVVVVSCTANPATAYDADPLLQMLAFYLMVGHLLQGQRSLGQSLTPGCWAHGKPGCFAGSGRKITASNQIAWEPTLPSGCFKFTSRLRWWPAACTSCRSRNGSLAWPRGSI